MFKLATLFSFLIFSLAAQAIDNNTFITGAAYRPNADVHPAEAPSGEGAAVSGKRTLPNAPISRRRTVVNKPVRVQQETATDSSMPFWDPSESSVEVSTAAVAAPPVAPAPEAPVTTDDGSSTELVAGGADSAETVSPLAPETSIRPRARPERASPEVATSAPAPAAATSSPETFDMTSCRYRRGSGDCWSNKSLTQRIQSVVANVAEVNRLHGAQLDPRYMLCTGYKESHFNPGALGGAGEKGMFQIMNSTGRAALRLGPRVLPVENFMDRMVNSSLAQTELSFLVLKMKVNEGASQRTLSGNASISDYWGLARRYNGAGPAAERYANKVTSCLRCLRENFPSLTGSINESRARNCLNRAQ